MFLHLSVILFMGVSAHPAWADTPRQTPRQTNPLGRHHPGQTSPDSTPGPPSRRLLLRTARILLECILVQIKLFTLPTSNSHCYGLQVELQYNKLHIIRYFYFSCLILSGIVVTLQIQTLLVTTSDGLHMRRGGHLLLTELELFHFNHLNKNCWICMLWHVLHNIISFTA